MGEKLEPKSRGGVLDVIVYVSGPVFCSACAPKDFDGMQVEIAVDHVNPTGLDHGWTISTNETFESGEPNPCECNDDPERRHWLLNC